jgi:hypothetical protein
MVGSGKLKEESLVSISDIETKKSNIFPERVSVQQIEAIKRQSHKADFPTGIL